MALSSKGRLSDTAVDRLVRDALVEDLGPEGRDLTTSWVVGPVTEAEAEIRSGGSGVLSGLEVAARVFEIVDPECRLDPVMEAGNRFESGQVICRLRGRLAPILAGERVALNFLQRLCGVATRTRIYVDALTDFPGLAILDTRKTTPGLRSLERQAVLDGGGSNHRSGLYDAILIKDNHILAAGGVSAAVARARRSGLPVEVEVEDLFQLDEAIGAGADIVLLDNMEADQIRQAVEMADRRVKLEASGRLTLERALAAAAAGVDRISVGALTHSAPAIDLSLEITRTWA
ncbi:MAG TPA: carboxylating nicotinate-nucleotide diphosphorylase [Candidatus Dormibacteraeota bacterium]|jgi:nicotinate-nucleotide pyrophosphorylase (carboxylating)|nr:carboxylating nicotinate-nucleotide diphosphorylase [Candidatus Dormibacteraeota bacterium]